MARKKLRVAAAALIHSVIILTAAQAMGGVELSQTDANAEVVAALRNRGAEGLREALAVHDQLSNQLEELSAASMPPRAAQEEAGSKPAAAGQRRSSEQQIESLIARRDQWRAAIDQIGGQRSCTVSRLYWHTDFEQAKAEADRTGRPILSLRMLGKLTDEFSCANSRFFRTSLYSNQEISEYLRNNYVLHWQSVRPVPRVTIDFGDGRKLERTLTGNSAHYVLTAQGQPLDVLPGLYGPKRFLDWLTELRALHHEYTVIPESSRTPILAAFHAIRRDSIVQRWDQDIARLDESLQAAVKSRLGGIAVVRLANRRGGPPGAQRAGAVAVGKGAVEMPVLRFANLGGEQLEKAMDESLWQAISNLHRDEVKLDASSVALMRTEFPDAAQAGRVAITKARAEDPLLRVVRQFEESIGLDTVRNEYLLHRRIHEQFAAGNAVITNVDQLNEWVYAELFLTPSSDPWLGLAPSDVYTALEGNGQVVAR